MTACLTGSILNEDEDV
jgi:hypothetical protein